MIKKFLEFINENQTFMDEYAMLDDTFVDFDLSNIPKEKLKKQFKNFKFVVCGVPYGSRLVETTKQHVLSEGVNHSVDVEDVKSEMVVKYSLDEWQFEIKIMENDIKVAIIIPHIDENENMIMEDMSSLGYYLSFKNELKGCGLPYTLLQFEPRFPKTITNVVRNMGWISHWSPKYNLKSIRDIGFIPQSRNKRFNYPPRIHFLKSDMTQQQIESIGKQLCDNNDDVRNNGEYILFTLDVSKIPNNVEFIGDSCYKHGVCSETPIPYSCVTGEIERRFK